MVRSIDEVMARLTPAQRRTVRRRAALLIAEQQTLAQLRRSLELTQSELARSLGKGQDEVSRIEGRGDLRVSTLIEYVAGLGGTLELLCHLPGRSPVQLVIGEGGEAPVRAGGSRRKARVTRERSVAVRARTAIGTRRQKV